jgi:hypothetical protein
VKSAMDRLERDGEIDISVDSVGHRSAFVGAVRRAFPALERRPTHDGSSLKSQD